MRPFVIFALSLCFLALHADAEKTDCDATMLVIDSDFEDNPKASIENSLQDYYYDCKDEDGVSKGAGLGDGHWKKLLELEQEKAHECRAAISSAGLEETNATGAMINPPVLLFNELEKRIGYAIEDAGIYYEEMDRSDFSDLALWQSFSPLPDAKDRGIDHSFDTKSEIATACMNEGDNGKCPITYQCAKDALMIADQARVIATVKAEKFIKVLKEQTVRNDEDWQKFMFGGKPMWPWDVIWTDLVYLAIDGRYRNYDSGLVAPPDWQFFFLHPSVAMEYVPDEVEGNQFTPAAYVELLGANYWKNSPLSVSGLSLTGASLIVAYSDRVNAADEALGGMVTFNNTYSFGVTFRGAEIGIFLSLPMAALYKDQIYKSWDDYVIPAKEKIQGVMDKYDHD